MIIMTDLSQIQLNGFIFHDSITNTTNPGIYSRISYSNEYCVLNGLYLILPITCTQHSLYFKSEKYFYDTTNEQNHTKIEELLKLERDLLDLYANFSDPLRGNSGKTPEYKLQEKIKDGCIKLIRNSEVSVDKPIGFLIKLSGIWESDIHYGLTFRIFSLVDSPTSHPHLHPNSHTHSSIFPAG